MELIFLGAEAQPEMLNQMAIVLMVADEAKSRAKNAHPDTGEVMASVGYRSIRFHVKDVDVLAGSLKESGVAIPTPPHKRRGGQAMQAADPDGNYLEFVSAP